MISVIDLTNPLDVSRVKRFSEVDHPSTFRYFKNRVFDDAIKTHKVTVLYTMDDKDVGYAHVDVDTKSHRAFFGICVLPDYQSKGIGKQLTDYVMQTYRDTVYLTVDSANTPAIGLYKKFGFELVESYASSGLWVRKL